jgi:transposase
LAPGSNVSAIARSHGLDPSQVYAWRRKALASGAVSPLTGQVKPVRFTRFEAVGSEMVEIVFGDVVVRVGGDVDPDRLVKIMRAVRKA